jgi:hypothetical protein
MEMFEVQVRAVSSQPGRYEGEWETRHRDVPRDQAVQLATHAENCGGFKARIRPSLSPKERGSDGAQLIAHEREKQRAKWGDAHDREEHDGGELARVAACLALQGSDHKIDRLPFWATTLAKKHADDRVHQLTVAGALIAAEIDRLNAK